MLTFVLDVSLLVNLILPMYNLGALGFSLGNATYFLMISSIVIALNKLGKLESPKLRSSGKSMVGGFI